MVVKTMKEVVECLKSYQDKGCGNGSEYIHATPTSHTDGGRNPYACRCGQSTHCILLEDNGTSTYKTYARHHLRGNTRHVKSDRVIEVTTEDSLKAVGRNNHKQGRAKGYEKVRSESCGLITVLTLQSNDTAQEGSSKDSQDEF